MTTVDIRIGVCRDMLRAMSDESVHCVVTSPPFYGLRNTDGAGLPVWESLGDDACTQLAALERAIGPVVHTWNGGAARHLRMAHGTAPRLARIRVPLHGKPGHTTNAARACISAHGDAILPKISEAIGRVILKVEGSISVLCAGSEA